MILGFHHTAIATTDLATMSDFYQSMMGFKLVIQQSWAAGSERHDSLTGLPGSSASFAVLRLGNACLELFQYHSPLPTPNAPDRPVSDAGLTHIAIAVDDIDAEFTRMSEAGVRFHCPPGPKGPYRATYGRDPEGNVFELIEISDPTHPFALRF